MSKTYPGWRCAGAAMFFVATSVVGCGSAPDTGPVAHWHGKVTIDGKPVPSDAEARISFMPEITGPGQKANPTSAQIVDSKYDAPNVPVGRVKATFSIVRWGGKTATAGADSSRPLPKWDFLVPEKHRDGMLLVVEEGEQTKDFDL